MLNSFVQIGTLASCKMDRMMQLVRSGLRLSDQNVIVILFANVIKTIPELHNSLGFG